MSTTPNIRFGQIREAGLKLWLQWTGRTPYPLTTIPGAIMVDDFENGNFECQWQNNARQIKQDSNWHVAHFCSLGEWGGNVTDILTDSRFDTTPVGLGFPQHRESLFRYYTRFMLVVSEMMVDFGDILQIALDYKRPTDRAKLSTTTIDVKALHEYINSVCKHKVKQDSNNSRKLHPYNHHLPIFFEDSKQTHNYTSPLAIGSSQPNKPDAIIVPKLGFLISAIINGYVVLDDEFRNNPNKFNAFISDPKNGESLPS